MSHRVFKPVILFHDHSYSTNPSGVTHRIHIPYGDPHYTPLIQQKKQKVGLMLQTNGRVWYDIIKSTRLKYKTPKPSLYKKRHYYQTKVALSSSSSEEDLDDEEDDNHSTMTSSSSSCTTNSSNTSIASPIPTSTTTSNANNSSTTSNTTIIARKRRGNLPKTVTAVLKQWLIDHCRNPYPTEAEKTGLKDKTSLTLNQISNWFINARRRLLPQILDTMHPNHKETSNILHHHHEKNQHHGIMEDDDAEECVEDDDIEEEEDGIIPMPQQQKRKRKNYMYNTNSQQEPTTVIRKRRRYNKRSNIVLST
ncbi:hypothetical protein INT46_011680 [Mucor plumbeus]|uniref:Homeobox domain-containing protein n=1 Tax=Mucor plumbeus TaxID=97098 RepID=A0A8H7UX43_9FUNG|nr:hypothetical protein INT46_011680 [Mucor plumbeus]